MMDWSRTRLLKFNIPKCKVMHIGTQNDRHPYRMDNIQIDKVTSEKDLGVLFTNGLKFSEHIDKIVSIANSMLGLIKRTFKHWTVECFNAVYKTYIHPHLEYAVQLWSPQGRVNINKIEKVQRRAIKIIPSLRNLTYEERLQILDISKLEDRRVRGDTIEVFKIMNDLENIGKNSLFQILNTNRRGHSKQIFKQRCTKTQTQHTFSHRITDKWNALPNHIVNAKTVTAFKNSYDKHTVQLNMEAGNRIYVDQ